MRILRQPDGARSRLRKGVVEDVAGPNDGGTGWEFVLRVGNALWVLPEEDLEALARSSAPAGERSDTLELRLVTDLTDGIVAAQVAERLDAELRRVVGPAIVSIEAERHWAEPYWYELQVSVRPLGDAVEALRALAAVGGDGWLSCRDDGWRCDLWWHADEDEPGLLVQEVRDAEVTFLPWGSPARRPEHERPLVSVVDAL